jgi:hypothetical protein
MINYKLRYIQHEIRWEMDMDGSVRDSGRKIS